VDEEAEMRLPWLAVALLVVAGAGVDAGEIFHPDANPAAGGAGAIPWGQTEVRYQTLVPKGVMGSKAIRITELSFAPGANGMFQATQLEIRMAHTTAGRLLRVFDNNLQKDRTTVYNGAVTWTATKDQWSPVGLQASFSYNGVEDLVIEIRFQGGKSGVNCHSGRITTMFVSGAGSYTAQQGGMLQLVNAPKIRLTFDETVLTATGITRPGGTVDFTLKSTADGGLPYQLGTSLGTGPIPIDTRKLGLSPDALLVVSVGGTLPFVFANYSGLLDAQGLAQAKLNIPAIPALVGLRPSTAFLTLKAGAPSGVANISNTFTFSITS